MARIRSVHPGLFTDEAFAQLSDGAQVFWIGLWTEADDRGIFEWKPISLKMRLRPASITPVDPLLDELRAVDCIRMFESGGRKYGAIRNFQRFQRPKKPNSLHPIPPEFRTYIGSSDTSSELEHDEGGDSSPPKPPDAPPVPPNSEPEDDQEAPVPKKSEIAPQMEDGGWRMEEGEEKAGARSRPPAAPDPARGTRLPDDWLATPAERDYARSHGLDPDATILAFTEFWWASAGAKARKANWGLAFRTWCRLEAERRKSRPGGAPRAPQPTFGDAIDAAFGFDVDAPLEPEPLTIDGELHHG